MHKDEQIEYLVAKLESIRDYLNQGNNIPLTYGDAYYLRSVAKKALEEFNQGKVKPKKKRGVKSKAMVVKTLIDRGSSCEHPYSACADDNDEEAPSGVGSSS
jgi:hypothetical protein